MAPGTGWVLGGRYRVLERLGTGGMAEVFRAHDETLDRDVAVKVFRSVVEDPDDPGGEERRELELHALARLNHPHLVTLYDGTVTHHPGYLVLELVDGPTLAQRLHEGPLSEAAAAQLGAQIADALAYVHANGMVHRDVKPANILLGSDGGTGPDEMRARLSDFGIVRLVGGSRVTAVGRTMGTASYLAPEQARGLDVGAPADVYSLGLVLIEALTGVPSFEGPMEEVVAARLSRPPEVPATLPQPWPALLTAMTTADPAARPDAATVAATLRGAAPVEALASLPTAAVPPVAAFGAGPGLVTGAVAGAATGPLTGASGPATGATGPAAAPVLAPLPVGDERGVATRPRRSGMGWALGAVALAAILIGGLAVLLTASGGGSPGNSPAPSNSDGRIQGPPGGSLAAKTSTSRSSEPVSNSAPDTTGASQPSGPSSAPQTSSSASTSQPPSSPRSSRTSTTSTSTTRSSRPPSSSSAPRTSSSAASSSSTVPAPARSSSPTASTSTSIHPGGP